MTENSRTLSVAIIAAWLVCGCSWFGERESEYLASMEGRPLQVPDDLDTPRPVSPMVIRVEPMPLPSNYDSGFLPPRAAVTAGGGDANTHLAWSASGAYLAVRDTPTSVARRLRFAIQRSGMNLVERDDATGHTFSYRHVRVPQEKSLFQKLLFWRSNEGPDYSGTYKLKFEPDGEETRVYLIDANASPADANAAEYILGIFMERLG